MEINIILIFLVILINFILAKRLSSHGVLYSKIPSLSDIYYSFVLASSLYILNYLNLEYLAELFFIVLYVLLFIDIAMFKVYSINLDYTAIRIFFKNPQSYSARNTDVELKKYIKSRNLYLYPVLTILIITSLNYDLLYENYILATYGLYILIVFAKIRLNILSMAIYLAGAWLMSQMTEYQFDTNYVLTNNGMFFIFFVVAILILIKKLTSNRDTFFFSKKSKLLDFMQASVIKIKKPSTLYKDHQKIVDLVYKLPTKTNLDFARSNVILITFESLSKNIFEELKMYKELDFLNNSHIISSANHHAISGNTFESLSTLYNGTYKERALFPYIDILRENNYKSIFFTPHDLLIHQTDELLQQSKFDALIFSRKKKFKNKMSIPDGNFYKENYQELKESLQDNKYFLHILNSQTHSPYETSEKNKAHSLTRKNKYCASLKEGIDELNNLMNKLNQDNLLTNSIIIFTGDHGQAFGELEYKAHSTSITKEQIKVPFFITHPKLQQNINLQYSTHFDIFPTILDLLNIYPTVKTLGESILSNNQTEFIVYSKTKINGLPSSFGFINSQEKIFIDLMYERYWLTDLDDNIIKILNDKEKNVIMYSLIKALKLRELC